MTMASERQAHLDKVKAARAAVDRRLQECLDAGIHHGDDDELARLQREADELTQVMFTPAFRPKPPKR